MPKISIVIPIHEMKNGAFFLWRAINSIMEQTFKDYEIIIIKEGKMAENTNAGIKKARGEFIKILYMDDYLTDNMVLASMMTHLKDHHEWAICGTHNNLNPTWTDNIIEGNNKLGSPSALIFRNYGKNNVLFDERMSWLLDVDYYHRMEQKFGKPVILTGNYITLGEGDHQMTHILTDEEKLAEHNLLQEMYA